MNLQADINWIQSELKTVKEPHLIEAIKHLLAYRKVKVSATTSFFSTTANDLQQRAEASLKSVEQGKTRDINEFKKEVENWKSRQAI